MSKFRFLFRCDANAASGFGHLSRCLNIAREIQHQLSDVDITFMGNYNEFAHSLLINYKFNKIEYIFSEATNKEVISIAQTFSHLIADSYFITQSFIDVACGNNFKFILVDDFCALSDYSHVDLLLNFTIQAPSLSYGAKKCALGISYFPVKPELKAIREINLPNPKKEITKIAFCISAMPNYWELEEELVNLADKAFTAVELKLVSSRTKLLNWKSKHANTFIQQKPSFEIEKLYNESDLIISGGGLVKYEAAYCGLLNATISLTAGVAADTQLFEKEKLTFNMGTAFNFEAEVVLEKLKKIRIQEDSSTFLEATKRIFQTNATKNLVSLILTL